MKQLALFTENPQIARIAPEPPRNPDPPPVVEKSPPPKQSLALCASEDSSAKTRSPSDSTPSTLRDKLLERRKREALNVRVLHN